MAGLAAGLPIVYNSVVQSIEYSEDRVRVSTASKSFEGKLPYLSHVTCVPPEQKVFTAPKALANCMSAY